VTFSRSRQMQIQSQNIPYLGCYLVDETMVPDGDFNAGEPRFKHTLILGFSVIVLNNKPDDTENVLDASFWAIMNGLLTDTTLVALYDTALPDATAIEGFTRANRRHVYGQSTGNEMPIGELQFNLSCMFRTYWPPIVLDDLDVIHVTTGFPIEGPQSERDKVLQVTSVYDIPQNEE